LKKKEKTLAITILSKIITIKYDYFNESIKIKTIGNQCSIKRFENNYFETLKFIQIISSSDRNLNSMFSINKLTKT
jgi:hypothetical protein